MHSEISFKRVLTVAGGKHLTDPRLQVAILASVAVSSETETIGFVNGQCPDSDIYSIS